VLAAKKQGKLLLLILSMTLMYIKLLKALPYSLTVHPDPVLDKLLDSLITIICCCSGADGYLYTARTIDSAASARMGPGRTLGK